MSAYKKPTANLDWSLWVCCPKCSQSNDMATPNHDGEHDIARHIFSNKWDALKDWEVACEHCGHEFKIECVEY